MPSDPGAKMFGLQRTCTNVVLKGLKANYYIASCEKGREWKHGPIGPSGDDIPVIVCCFREPLAWLVSMYRWSFSDDRNSCPHFRREWSFPDFLSSKHYDWPTPLDRWNKVNRHYLEWVYAHPDRGIVVRSEDMMSPEDARQQYLRIGAHFHLRRRDSRIHVFRRRVSHTGVLQQQMMDFGYYTQRRYMAEYTDDMRKHLMDCADPWVLGRLGYTTE